jgi:putative oxidoreductase
MTEIPGSTALLERAPEVAAPAAERSAARGPVALVDTALELNRRVAPHLLRLALAAVFVWFGALKLAGVSPVHELIGATLPFVDPDLAVPVLGGVEVLLGLVLAAGVLPRITLLVLVGHLAGTFLTFVTASELMWSGTLFELTADGEFVVKNLVLITAALVLIGWYSGRERRQH